MIELLTTQLGRFRLAAFAEGSTLLILVFVTVPLRILFEVTQLSKVMGPIHGLLFVVYVFQTIQIKIDRGWSLKSMFTLLAAAIIPFGTFYFVPKILKKYNEQ